MSYSQALEQKAMALYAFGSRAGLGVVQAMMNEKRYDDSERSDYWNMLCLGLSKAEPYYWAPDICDMIGAAAKSIPAWTFKFDRLPSTSGYFWFSKPIELPKDGDWQGDLNAISWTDVDCMTDDMREGYTQVPGSHRIYLTGDDHPGVRGINVFFWSNYGQAVQFPFGTPVTSFVIKDGTTLGEIDGYSEHVFGGAGRNRRLEKVAVLAAALEFVSQEILTTHQERPARSTRRRLEAMGVYEEQTIHVVKMRRIAKPSVEQDGDDRRDVAWSCKWIVRGHWRQQACGENYSERRPVWVVPHIKGPSDKPLKPPSERVFAVVR